MSHGLNYVQTISEIDLLPKPHTYPYPSSTEAQLKRNLSAQIDYIIIPITNEVKVINLLLVNLLQKETPWKVIRGDFMGESCL